MESARSLTTRWSSVAPSCELLLLALLLFSVESSADALVSRGGVLMGVLAEDWVFTFTPSPRAFPFHFVSF